MSSFTDWDDLNKLQIKERLLECPRGVKQLDEASKAVFLLAREYALKMNPAGSEMLICDETYTILNHAFLSACASNNKWGR